MRNKKVLITGSEGFVGKHLVERLIKEGYNVYTLQRTINETPSIINRVIQLQADIRQWAQIRKLFIQNNFDICFHLASQALVEQGVKNPRKTLKTNVEGTWNILEAARISDVERVILASTSHVYGNNTQLPYKEYYIPRPSRIYETSKTCADIIAQTYITTYKMPIFIPRFTNIYGPGDMNFTRIIPKTIKNIHENKNLKIWGEGIVRDYLYIDDAIDAYIKLINFDPKKIRNYIFNFGGHSKVTTLDLVNLIMQLSGKKNIKVEIITDSRRNEIKEQYVSSDKAKKILQWKPTYTLEEGLTRTIKWYRKQV